MKKVTTDWQKECERLVEERDHFEAERDFYKAMAKDLAVAIIACMNVLGDRAETTMNYMD